MPKLNQNTGHSNAVMMSENFVNILHTGVILTDFTVSNLSYLPLVTLNYFDSFS